MLRSLRAVLATELRLAPRNADMVLFGLAFPVAVMLLIGFVSPPESVARDFPGVAAFGICAAGIMGLPLTIADYRHRKVLKRLRATPASPALLLGSQALVQWLFSSISGLCVAFVARALFGVRLDGGAARFALAFAFVQASIFGIGFLIASLAPTMKSANAIASLLYFPMVFLSGATVPYDILPAPVRAASDLLPLTQGIKLLKAAAAGAPLEASLPAAAVLACLGLASYAVSLKSFRWE